MELPARIAQLIRKVSTTLPPDIVRALGAARAREDAAAASIFDVLLRNAALAETSAVPMCQDTGTLTFWIDLPVGENPLVYEEAVREAVRIATDEGVLRLNVIDTLSGAQIGDNVADGNPAIHFRFADAATRPRVSLLMKGGGSENVSTQYSLPDSALGAGRDLDGVRKCVLDAVWRAQGNGCAPGIIGVCQGGDRATGLEKAKEQLLRPLDDVNENPELAEFEARLLEDANALGIGPMGLGGKTTLLGVKMCAAARLPASYYVSVAYCCWACRRGKLGIRNEE